MNRRILVVDDEKTTRTILGKYLKDCNYDVTMAMNGEEALSILQKSNDYSAIILDTIMPVMDGYEVLKRIRADENLKNIPVLVQTADRDSEKKALALGANDCIIKPCDCDILGSRLRNTVQLREDSAMVNAIKRDSLTGLLSRTAFLEKVGEMVTKEDPGHYVLSCFDIEKFKVVNDLYGTHKGDEVLRMIAKHFTEYFSTIDGICCRANADNFAVLYPARLMDSPEVMAVLEKATNTSGFLRTITFSVGRYIVEDITLSPSAMYDRAMIAKATIKGLYDTHVAIYDESMRSRILSEQEIVSEMNHALLEKQFEVWYQPQYNHETGALIGSEALVRWRHPEKGLISPGTFIPIFEKNGFVYEIDKYVWEESCIFLRELIDTQRTPMPISVNISRYDIFQTGLCDFIVSLAKKYNLTPDLLRLEITESAFAKSTDQIIHVVEEFKKHGFLVEIDDFGSGYSSLNTLKDVPADVLKLDMKFLEGQKNSEKGGNIVASIVRMAKWIGMSIIAEGVETVHQANFLKSIGCCYIQGYLYSKPLPKKEYEDVLAHSSFEGTMLSMENVETYNMEAFWDPASMETIMFNSFVGGACIFEFHKGKVDLLRINEKYVKIFGGGILTESYLLNTDFREHICDKDFDKAQKCLQKAVVTNEEVVEDIEFQDYLGSDIPIYIRAMIRVIAKSGDRYLFYCMMEDISEQKIAEMKHNSVVNDISTEQETNVQLQFVNDIAHQILAIDNVDDALQATVTMLTEHFNSDRAYIIEFNTKDLTTTNTYEACANGIESKMCDLQNIPTELDSKWISTLRDNKMIYLTNISSMEDGREDILQMLISRKIRSIIIAPLISSGELIGFFGVDNPKQKLNKCERLMALGDIISLTIVHRNLQENVVRDTTAIERLMADTPGGFARIFIPHIGTPTIEYVNDGFCNLLRMTKNEVMKSYGANALSFLSTEDTNFVAGEGKKRIADGKQFNIECHLLRKDGDTVPVTVFGRFTKTSTGEYYLNSYYSDISQAIEAKQQQNELLDNLPCGAALYRYDGKNLSVIHINKRYWELVQREPQNFTNNSVLNSIHPDDVAIVYQEILSAILQNRECSVNIRIRHGEEGYRPFLIVASIKEYEEGKYILYASYSPIDDEIMSFQEMLPVALSTLMETSDELSYVKDKSLRYICGSEAAAKVIGLNNAHDLVGKSDYELFDEDQANKYIAEDKSIMENGKAVLNHTILLKDANGGIKMISSSKYPLMSPSGKVIGIYGISHDITATKENEVQLQLLMSSIPGGIAAYSITPTGTKNLFFNEGYYSYSGYTREEYVQLISENPLALVFEEDRHEIKDLLQEFHKHKSYGEINSCSYRCHTKSGGFRWMSMKCKLSLLGNNMNILNVVQMDITEQKTAEESLRLSKEEYQIAAQHSGRTIGRYDIANHTLTITTKTAEILELPECIEDVPYGRVKLGKISDDTKDAYITFFENIARGEMEGDALFQKLLPNGWRWLNAHSTTFFSDEGKPVSALISYIDVTEQYEKDTIFRKWQLAIKNRTDSSYSLFRCHLDTTVESTASFDSSEGSLIPFAYVENEKLSFDECTELYAKQHVHPEDREEYINSLRCDQLIADFYHEKRKLSLEYRELQPDGNYRWLRRSIDLMKQPNSSEISICLMFENIDDSKRAELEVHGITEIDALTGLLNRNAFTESMNLALSQRRENSVYAFMILDIDGFKQVNNTLGHAAGNQVLIEAARSIHSALMAHDIIGRLEGDEFVVCLCDVPDRTVVRKKVRQVWQMIRRHVASEVEISASIGISMCPENGEDFDSLYRKADSVLTQIKQSGKDNYGFYMEP